MNNLSFLRGLVGVIMVQYGIIIGMDRKGNFKVRPEQGDRKVILSRSAASNFHYGQRVEYGGITPGDEVDFARSYVAADLVAKVRQDSSQVPKYTEPPRGFTGQETPVEGPSDELIQRTLSEADVSGIDAIILYDPLGKTGEYHFIAIGRTKERSRFAIDKIYEWGFGGGGTKGGKTDYLGTNRLYGESHHVIRDFREKVKGNPKQERILFLPLPGLNPKRYWGDIDFELLKKCVESAYLPDE